MTTTSSTSNTSRTNDSLLRLAIRVDGVVVAAIGVAMVLAAGSLSTLTGLPVAAEYAIGAFSIAYGPLAFWLAAQRRVRTTGLVVAAINAFTSVGLVALVAAGIVPTTTGVALAVAIAVYTALIGAVQYAGVRRV
jgi:hypothetical protein